MVLCRSVAPWRRLLTLCVERILFSEAGEILKQAAAAWLSNNSVCHWEFRESCSKLREKPAVPENEGDSK